MKRTAIFVDDELLVEAQHIAKQRGMTFTALVDEALRAQVQANRPPRRFASSGIGRSAQPTDMSDGADEAILRADIDPLEGWSTSGGRDMAAYLIVAIKEISDPERFAEYRRRVGATLDAYGGKYVTGRGPVEALEGDWQPVGLTVVEFADTERIHEWYDSSAYQALTPLREGAAVGDFVIVPGA